MKINEPCSPLSFKTDLVSKESAFLGHFEVTASVSGMYICKREVIYPPPSTVDCHTTEVIIAGKNSPTHWIICLIGYVYFCVCVCINMYVICQI